MKGRQDRSPAFTLIELLVVVAIIALLVSILLPALGQAKEAANKVFCSNNLGQFGRAAHMYYEDYKSFCPHIPYPTYGGDYSGWDPSTGFLMTYGMRMAPPEVYPPGHPAEDHFIWWVLEEDELPDICVCPSAKRENLFTYNDETMPGGDLEAFTFQYAAFYQFCGTIRSATPQRAGSSLPRTGGRNPAVPDPTLRPDNWSDNCRWASIYIWVNIKDDPPDDPDPGTWGSQAQCNIQGISPNEIDDPARVYYLADSRDYRPEQGHWAPAGMNDGWRSGGGTMVDGTGGMGGNIIYLGSRHGGYANVVYLDGHAHSGNQTHTRQYNMEFGPSNGARWGSRTWRAATFDGPVKLASISTQNRIMPVMMIKGWEMLMRSMK